MKEAATDTSGQVLFLGHLNGNVLQVKGKNLIEDGSERSRATWEAALEELERDELLTPVSYKRNVFKVTRKGYEVADRLP